MDARFNGWMGTLMFMEPDGCLVILVMDVKGSGFSSQGERENWKKRLWLQNCFLGVCHGISCGGDASECHLKPRIWGTVYVCVYDLRTK